MQRTEFDLFEWHKDNLSTNIKKKNFQGIGSAYLLEKAFFQTYIDSRITQTSTLHPIYCFNFPSADLVSIRDKSESSKTKIPKTKAMLINEFYQLMSDSYEPSIYGFKCLNSCTFSLFVFGSTENKSKKFIVYGYALYRVDPLVGLVLVFLHVKERFQKEGVGTAIMQCLQYFSSKCIGSSRVLVWVTKLANTDSNDLIRFYRNRGFYPTIAGNLALNYIFPSNLIQALLEIDVNAQKNVKEFVLECRKKICKLPEQDLTTRKGLNHYICNICNFKQNDCTSMCLCEYTLKDSFMKLKPKQTRSKKKGNKPKSICGVMLCYNCHSNFGCTLLNRCPLHHHDEELVYQESEKTAQVEKKEKQRKESIQMAITDSYSKSIDALKKRTFFCQDIYDTDVTNSSYCAHCKLLNNSPDGYIHETFQVANLRLRDPAFHEIFINNVYDVRNFRCFHRQGLTNLPICPFANKDICNVHQLAFTSNSGKPASLLCNRLFGIRNVDGHGDCGVLSILFALLSSNSDLLERITLSIQTYIDNNVKAKSLFTNKIFLSVTGIRELLFFAKIDDNNPYKAISDTDFEYEEKATDYDIKLSDVFDEYSKAKTEKNLERLRSLFIQSRDKSDNGEVYWLTQNDMLNIHYITGGLVCVLVVLDFDDPLANNHEAYLHDCGYSSFNEKKKILSESSYFILLRHVGKTHYDLFYDRKRKTCIFPTNAFNEPDSAISILLQIVGPICARRIYDGEFELDQQRYGYFHSDNAPDIPIEFYHEIPSLEKWSDRVDLKHEIYISTRDHFHIFAEEHYHLDGLMEHIKLSIKSDEEAMSIEFHRSLVLKHVRDSMIPIILNTVEFEKEYNYKFLGYFGYMGTSDELFDFNKIGVTDMCKCLTNKLIFGLSYMGEHINSSRELFDSVQWRIATKDELNKAMVYYAWQSFLQNVHGAGCFSYYLRSFLGRTTLDGYTQHDVVLFRIFTRLTNDQAFRIHLYYLHLMLHIRASEHPLWKFTDSLWFSSNQNDIIDDDTGFDHFVKRLLEHLIMDEYTKVQAALTNSFLYISKTDIIQKISDSIDGDRYSESSSQIYKKASEVIKKVILKKDNSNTHLFIFFSYLSNEDFRLEKKDPDDYPYSISEWIELISDLVYDDEFLRYEQDDSISAIERNTLKNMRFAACIYFGFVDLDTGIIGITKEDVIKYMEEYKNEIQEKLKDRIVLENNNSTEHDKVNEDLIQQSNKKNLENEKSTTEADKVNDNLIQQSNKINSENDKNGTTSSVKWNLTDEMMEILNNKNTELRIQTTVKMPHLANEKLKQLEYHYTFHYDKKALATPKIFVSLDDWTKNNGSELADRTPCITSSTNGFSLTYAEIYGRLLGLQDVTDNNDYVNWLNTSIIDAAINLFRANAQRELLNYLVQNPGINEVPNDIFTSIVYVTDTNFHTYFVDEMNNIQEAMENLNMISSIADYSIFLIPWLLGNRHWVLLYIDVDKKEIFVLDSSVEEKLLVDKSKQEMLKALRFICVLLLEENTENNSHEAFTYDTFTWITFPEANTYPQLKEKFDSGVFLLMAIHSILKSNGLQYFNTHPCTNIFRDYIFDCLKSKMANDQKIIPDNRNFELSSESSSSETSEEESKYFQDSSTDEDSLLGNEAPKDMTNTRKSTRVKKLKSKAITGGKNISESSTNKDEEKAKKKDSEKTLNDIIVMYKANNMVQKLRKRHVKHQQFNENVIIKLKEIKALKGTKYILALKHARDDYDYYVSASKLKDPRTESGGKDFFQLRYEFVETRCLGEKVNKEVVTFMKSLQSKTGIWCEMSNEFKKIFHETALKEDREHIIRRNCSYSMISIKNPNHKSNERFFASIIINGKTEITDEVTYEDLKQRNLSREIRELRSKNEGSEVYLTHGAAADKVKLKYKQDWPKVVFQQGNTNNCLLRSVSSVIFHLIYEEQINENVTEYLLLMLNTLNDARIFDKANSTSCTLNKIINYMRAYGFKLDIYSKKRKRGKRKRECNILSNEFDIGIFCIAQICGSDYDTNHTVCITNKWIFDSNHERALPLCLDSLNICSSSRDKFVMFEKCEAVFKFSCV